MVKKIKYDKQAIDLSALQDFQKYAALKQNEVSSSTLMEALARDELEEYKRQAERSLRRIGLLKEAIDIDIRALKIEGAVAKWRLVAKEKGLITDEEISQFLLSKIGVYEDQDNYTGNISALLVIVALYTEILKGFSSVKLLKFGHNCRITLG